MFLKSFVTTALLLAGISLSAQDVVVKGYIVSCDETPVEAAEIKSTSSGSITSSDKFGRFEITVPINTEIIISKSGFSSYQQTITKETSLLTVRLDLGIKISTGYQELPSTNLTSSIASVQQHDFNIGLISSPELLIQGKVAGVRVMLGSGEPGSDTFTYIRGVASLRGSEPLFIVDGFPLLNDDPYASSTNFGRGTSHHRDPLNFINPNDIESIDILKDETATAMYGSRGGNGVVFIKTKAGRAKHQLQFSSQFSLSSQRKYYDLLKRDQFLSGLADRGGDSVASDFGGNTDWQREINQSPLSQKYDLSCSNQYKSGSYRVSIGYDNQQGVIQESGMKRLSGHIQWNQSLKDDRLRIAANLSMSRLDDEYAFITTNAGFQGDLLGSTYTANPTWENDPEFQLLSYSSNPLSILKYHYDQSTTNATLFNLSATYDLTQYFSVQLKGGINSTSSEREAAISPSMFMTNGVDGNGRSSIKNLDKRSDLLEATLNYSRTFKNSEFKAFAGYAFQVFSNEGSNIEGRGFSNPNLTAVIDDLSQSATIIKNSLTTGYLQYGNDPDSFFVAVSNPTLSIIDLTASKPVIPVKSVKEDLFGSNDELQSFFANMNYNINEKIFLKGSLRVDGSTLFGSNNKYGLFPAISASWRLSEETFIPELFSDLKLRAGYGKSGNQNIPHGAHSSRQQFSIPPITANGDIPTPVLISTGFDNQDLKWEETTGINVGIDFGFAENRFHGSLDVYNKTTTDFLFYRPLAQPAIVESTLVNSDGKIINSGVELGLDISVIRRNNLNINFFLTGAYNKNTLKDFTSLLDIGNVYGQGLSGATVQQIHTNEPLYSFYLREFQGFDANGFSTYKGGQKIVGKDPIPNLTFAFGGTLQFKNWDATILFSGLAGYSMYNNTANAYFTSGSLANARNVTTDVLTSTESPQNAPEVSTRFLEDADFLRIQNISAGRNFHFKKRPFKIIRAFLTGQNLVTWTDYSGLDPDTNTGSMGIDYSTYPKARIFTIGLQVAF
ncbi:MAG TPA: TonB-dependent receptor [Cyclobacteriaceae bacterium]|nr:TonB-dependent receptor [Cyclobacteriaceae bacterium]